MHDASQTASLFVTTTDYYLPPVNYSPRSHAELGLSLENVERLSVKSVGVKIPPNAMLYHGNAGLMGGTTTHQRIVMFPKRPYLRYQVDSHEEKTTPLCTVNTRR